jgi:2'-5' RNA ligase
MIRLFVAVALPPESAEALAGLRDGLRGAAWHAVEKLHLTLRFIGEIDEAKAEDLDGELAAISLDPPTLSIAGVGAFEADGAPHHLWAGVEAGPDLARLRKLCERAARRAGLPADVRVWRPHVTLAYLRRPDPRAVAGWIAAHNLLRLDPTPVCDFGLYSSRRGRRGQAYRQERSYPVTPRRDP